MRKAYVSVNGIKAGILEELQSGKYQFSYIDDYHESVRERSGSDLAFCLYTQELQKL
ncbi:TPA: hypothetical protein ACVO5S_000850 [Legionella pneumophila]